MNRTKPGAMLTFGALFLALTAGSLAWACTPQPQVTLTPAFAAPGKTVTVKGERFTPGTPVEIRWNGTSGTILGVAEGPEFSTQISIPKDVRPDVFFLVAIQRNVTDRTGRTISEFAGTAPIGVLKPAARGEDAAGPDVNAISRATASDLWSGYGKGQPGGSSISAGEGPGVVSSRRLAVSGGILAVTALGIFMWLLVFVRPRRSSSAN